MEVVIIDDRMCIIESVDSILKYSRDDPDCPYNFM